MQKYLSELHCWLHYPIIIIIKHHLVDVIYSSLRGVFLKTTVSSCFRKLIGNTNWIIYIFSRNQWSWEWDGVEVGKYWIMSQDIVGCHFSWDMLTMKNLILHKIWFCWAFIGKCHLLPTEGINDIKGNMSFLIDCNSFISDSKFHCCVIVFAESSETIVVPRKKTWYVSISAVRWSVEGSYTSINTVPYSQRPSSFLSRQPCV